MARNSNSPYVITFRPHHNAYKEGDGSGAQIVHYKEPEGTLYRFLKLLYGVVIIHYFLWFIPMLLCLYLPYHFGYPVISFLILGVYLPTYFNKDELKLGRTWDWFRQHKAWRLLQHYAQLEIVREEPLDANRKYILAYHPHGILILSRIGTYSGVFEELFPGMEQRCLGATPMFQWPGAREICLWMGAVRADKSNAVRILQSKKISLLLYPGGSDEIFETNPDSKDNIIIARKGFIRLALQQGCDLVPSFVFGEKHAYNKLDIPEVIKSFFMKKLRTPLIIFWGKFFSWLPREDKNVFLSIVYGKPIKIDHIVPEPSDELVDETYNKFYGEIQRLFEFYKERYGYDKEERLIIREAKSSRKHDKVTTPADKNGHKIELPKNGQQENLNHKSR